MIIDLLIKNGLLVTPKNTFSSAVAIDKGKIIAIGSESNLPRARRILDIEGKYVLPGAIDSHVHFRDPGHPEKEDFKSGSSSAAMGGITTVLDMPNTGSLARRAVDIKEKRKIAEKKSYVDFGFFGAITDDISEIKKLAEAGVVGYKVFLGYKKWEGNPMAPTNDGYLYLAMKEAAETNLRVSFHAENADIINLLSEEMKKKDRNDLAAYLESRPSIVEEEAVLKICLLAKNLKCKINICHISSGKTVDIIKEFAEKIDYNGETTPHYLFFTDDDYIKIGNVIKVSPPIRTKNDQEKLWEGIKEGIIKVIATDHAPHRKKEKEFSNIWDCSSGFPGVETMVPVLLTSVNSGRISINRLVELISVNPAIVWNLYPQKGSFVPGTDADFSIIDINREWIFNVNQSKSKAKYSPFNSMKMKGKVLYTILRGNIIVDNGELIDKQLGKMVTLQNRSQF